MTLQPYKCPNAQTDVIHYWAKPSALCAFNQTLLFQAAMIHLNPPRRLCKIFSFRFAHLLKARRPIFRRAVCRAEAEHLDFSKTFEPNHVAAAAKPGFGDGFQPASVDVDLPVRLQARQKMPVQRTHQLQIFNRSLPAIKTNKFRVKSTLPCGKQHFGKVVVFGFPIAVACQTRDNQPGRTVSRPSRAK